MDTFAQWLHQHSFLVVVCTLLVGSFFLTTWFRQWTRRTFVVWIGCFVLSVVVVLGLRTPAATVSELVRESDANSVAKTNMVNSAVSNDEILNFFSAEDIEAYLANSDRPTLVEFYSDLGIGWMLVFPAVSRISETWTAGRTLRLNIAVETNKEFAESLRVTTTPTFILFNASGKELERWMHEAPTVDELPE